MITLFTTGCPKCTTLKAELDKKGLKYITETDIDVMMKLGFREVPVLKVDDKTMNYTQSVEWLKNMEVLANE